MVKLIIKGEPKRKSNSRRIFQRGRGGKPMVVKSKGALAYEESFLEQVPEHFRTLKCGSLKTPLVLYAALYYKSNRPDVSIELITDLLEKSGVVRNDRYIKERHVYGFVDRENPRAELVILELSTPRIPPFDLTEHPAINLDNK